MFVIVTVRGAVGMHMIVFMMGVFPVNFYFSIAATTRRTH
jgi:uncharacterized membrane protein